MLGKPNGPDSYQAELNALRAKLQAADTRIAELEAKPEYPADIDLIKRTATESALRWAANNKPGGHMDRGSWTYETDAEYISRCLNALLGEGE